MRKRREHETKRRALEEKIRGAEIALRAHNRARALANVRQHQKDIGRVGMGRGKEPHSLSVRVVFVVLWSRERNSHRARFPERPRAARRSERRTRRGAFVSGVVCVCVCVCVCLPSRLKASR